jgi:hypothetical protein
MLQNFYNGFLVKDPYYLIHLVSQSFMVFPAYFKDFNDCIVTSLATEDAVWIGNWFY